MHLPSLTDYILDYILDVSFIQLSEELVHEIFFYSQAPAFSHWLQTF